MLKWRFLDHTLGDSEPLCPGCRPGVFIFNRYLGSWLKKSGICLINLQSLFATIFNVYKCLDYCHFFHQLSTMSQFHLRIFCLNISHWVYYTNHKVSERAIKFLVKPTLYIKKKHWLKKIETSLIKGMHACVYNWIFKLYTLCYFLIVLTHSIYKFIHLGLKTNFLLL